MATSPKPPEKQPTPNIRWPDVDAAIALIDELLAADDEGDDPVEWETVKKLLDEDRVRFREFFVDE